MTAFQQALLSHLARLQPGETFIITPFQIIQHHLTHAWIHQHAGPAWKITPQDNSPEAISGVWISWHLTLSPTQTTNQANL